MRPYDLVLFETSVHWAFHVPDEGLPPSWGGNKYQSDFYPGDRLRVPREIAEARSQAGLGKITVGFITQDEAAGLLNGEAVSEVMDPRPRHVPPGPPIVLEEL